MKRIGITTTIPIEILLAKGYKVIDLNNSFIVSPKYEEYIKKAEKDGFPKNMCAWIKGIYGACLEEGIEEIVGVTQGDCSNTKVLLEVLEEKGVKIHPFEYPHSQDILEVKNSIDKFMLNFEVNKSMVETQRTRLNILRNKALIIDELTLQGKVTGFENSILQLCLSDFDGDVDQYDELLDRKIEEFKKRVPNKKRIRLAYIGVPPMFGDLHDYIEEFDARVIYNEVQREFAFPRAFEKSNIYEQYRDYTYPYGIKYRLEELKKELDRRGIHGIIHYTQAFCHKAVDSIILKKTLDLPILTIEGDKKNTLDSRTKLRVEAFIDMVLDIVPEEEA